MFFQISNPPLVKSSQFISACISGAPQENNIMHGNAVIFRSDDTPWDGGTLKLTLQFTEDYLNKPPTMRFVSKMFHPNTREAVIEKGKQKEISPQEAAFIIQECFRYYMLRKSQTLHGLRELAMAKEKLKELRSLFTSYGYRRLLCRSEKEKQRFAVLLLTVESIEGANYLVRELKRSMIQVLESMLDSLDPGNDSFKKRKFDLPSGPVEQEMEVQQVMNMTKGKSEE